MLGCSPDQPRHLSNVDIAQGIRDVSHDRLSLYRLREAGYEQIGRSEIPELATLDMELLMELLTRCLLIAPTSRLEAANALRQTLTPSQP